MHHTSPPLPRPAVPPDDPDLIALGRDSLTGLLTRDAFLEALRRRTTERGDSPRGFALLAIDLDRFKAVNDTLGHPMGDALLTAVGRRIRSCIRTGDLAGRLGGDEFAILLPYLTSEAEANGLAARLVDLLSRPFLLQGHSIVIGCSVGIAVHPVDADDAPGLMRCADLALYQAKAEGRGDKRRFVPALRARAEARRQLEADLRAAIALGQFRLHYQPHIDIATGHLAGFEALLRWLHPERGLVSPAEFIPLAEEVRLIVPIGEWVLRTACRDAAGWPHGTASVAVNVSAPQLARRELARQVRSALSDSGLAPQRLELEVTETALLHDTSTALETCAELRRLGVRISLDDFGTGYSSLTQLRDFPLDRVKIDRSFIRVIESQPASAAIVRAVAGIGAALGLRTTAEGVETAQQLHSVQASGCTDAQGFLFSRPVPAEEVPDLIAGLNRP
jgi:diguanylate cyclase (GGDEF)-like protein